MGFDVEQEFEASWDTELVAFDRELEPTPSEREAAQTDTTPKKKPKTKNLAFLVPLSEAIRSELASLYRTYARTGVRPNLGRLRLHMIQQYVHVITPTSLDNAMLAASDFSLFLVGEDTELLGGLFAKRPKGDAKGWEAPVRVTVTIDQELLRAIRQRMGAGAQKPQENTPAPSLTGDNSESVAGALDWIWGLLKGDFNENPTVAQTIIRSLLGLIPGVDQVLDAEDLLANLLALTYQGRYNEFEPWLNLVLTLIGAIPELGSVLKGVGKLARKGISKLPLEEVVNVIGKLDLVEGAGRMRGMLGGFLGMVEEHAGTAIQRATKILEKQAELLETAKTAVSWVSASAKRYVERLIANTRAAIARAAEKIKAAFDYLANQFRRLLDELDERLSKLTRKTDDVADTPTIRTDTRVESTTTPNTRRTDTEAPTKKSEPDLTVSKPPPEMADLVTNNIARRGEAWGNNIYVGSCAHVAMRNMVSATLAGRETYVLLVSGLTQYGQYLKRFGLDPNGIVGRVLAKFGKPTTGGHAIAAVKGEDGVWRYISWGAIELDYRKFTDGLWGDTTKVNAAFTLDEHVKWMTENLNLHTQPSGTSPLLADVQREANALVGWFVE